MCASTYVMVGLVHIPRNQNVRRKRYVRGGGLVSSIRVVTFPRYTLREIFRYPVVYCHRKVIVSTNRVVCS